MTDYHVRPVNGDDDNNGLTPETAWKSFFISQTELNSLYGYTGKGGTYNCATVTDGDTVYLWAEGTTGGEVFGLNIVGNDYSRAVSWTWPLKDGNVSLIGVNADGVDDGTKYTVYIHESWGGSFSLMTNYPSFQNFYPTIDANTYQGGGDSMFYMKNIRITDTKQIDPTAGNCNGGFYVGSAIATPNMLFENCEFGPISNGQAPYHNRYGGMMNLVNCWIHGLGGSGTMSMSGLNMNNCLIEDNNRRFEIQVYNEGSRIENCVFKNNSASGCLEFVRNHGRQVVLRNNVFYNNDGFCIMADSSGSFSRMLLDNNIFDSNASVFDLNSQTLSWPMYGGRNNVFSNNTQLIINGGSVSVEDMLTIGFGQGESGGTADIGDNNYFTASLVYNTTASLTGPAYSDMRLSESSTVNSISVLDAFPGGMTLSPPGLGIAPAAPTQLSAATADFDSSLALNSTITFEGSGKKWKLTSKPKNGIPVFRRSR